MKFSLYRSALCSIASVICLTLAVCPSIKAQEASPTPSENTQWVAEQNAFLIANTHQKGWKTTADGLQYHLVQGASPSAAHPKLSDNVTVIYVGTLTNGYAFDSEWDKSMTFPLAHVIKGWQEALQMMRVGETWEFAIPPDLGYGHDEQTRIPADSVLIFKIQLIQAQP